MNEKEVLIIFRCDDYSGCSQTTADVRVIDIFRQHHLSLTLGVTPYDSLPHRYHENAPAPSPLTTEKIDILRTAIGEGIVEAALHGHSHQPIGRDPGKYSEFSELDYRSQAIKISNGKKYLEGLLHTGITTFIPPWNSYDMNTLRALEHSGISTISASQYGVAEPGSLLKFLPSTCDPASSKEIVKTALQIPDKQPVIVIVFHATDFFESDSNKMEIKYKEFETFLDWLASQKDIRVCSIRQATKMISDLSAQRLLGNQSALRNLPSLFPGSLSGIYLSQNFLTPRNSPRALFETNS